MEYLVRVNAIENAFCIKHSFWYGTGVEEHHGLRFVYQTEETLRSIVGAVFNVLDVVSYIEMEDDDSLYVLASV